MKNQFKVGIISLILAQSLHAVVADAWWKLDKANNPPPENGGEIVINNPLVIYENSTLNLTTVATPMWGNQFYNGSITFDHDLTINLTIDEQERQGVSRMTSIYRVIGNATNAFRGSGSLNLFIDASKASGEQIFDIRKNGAGNTTKLDFDVKTTIIAKEGSKIFSILRNGGGEINFTNDLIIDLSQATGVLDNDNPNGGQGIRNTRAIFDNAEGGTINVNPNKNNLTIQLTGDIATYGNARTTINLTNANSFFNGKLELVGGPLTFDLSGGSRATLDIHIRNTTANVSLFANQSSLYADFTYHNNATPTTEVTLNNGGVWYIGKSNTVVNLELNNNDADLGKDNFKNLTNLSAVDFRFKDQGRTLRTSSTLNENSRYTLTATNIQGQNGVFRLFGVLNSQGWGEQKNQAGELQETIATDQVVATTQVFGTNYVQVFWNQGNFDKSLLNSNLEDKKIVVAKQSGLLPGGSFVGAITPIGVYNYITNLKREIYNTEDGAPGGWQWIVTDVQRADNSYMSRLLDSIFQTQFRIYKTQIDTLNLRMGELRKLNRVHGVWLRSKYGRLSSKETNQTVASWDEFASIWLGYDQNFFVLGGKNFLGFSFDVNFFNSNGIPDKDDTFNPSYIGQSQSYGFSVYDTFFFDNGFYIDALAKYYFTDNKFIIRSEVLEKNTPEFFSHNFYASLEIGKRFKLPVALSTSPKDYLYLKPDAGMSFAFSSGQDWHFMDWSNQSVNARLDFNVPLSMRTGLTFGWTWNSRGYEGDLYAGTSFEYDFNTGGDLRLEDFLDRVTLTHGGNFNWRINAGTNIILNEYWRIYFDVDTAFFGTINSSFTLNAGVRINFGRLHPQMPYIPPHIETPDEDFGKYPKWRRTIPEVQNYETEGILDNYSNKRKRKIYQPKVIIKQKPYEGSQKPQNQKIQELNITPQIQKQFNGAPEFIDNPEKIPAPSQNYKRDTNMPMYQNTNPQQNRRSMDNIKENYNRGYR